MIRRKIRWFLAEQLSPPELLDSSHLSLSLEILDKLFPETSDQNADFWTNAALARNVSKERQLIGECKSGTC